MARLTQQRRLDVGSVSRLGRTRPTRAPPSTAPGPSIPTRPRRIVVIVAEVVSPDECEDTWSEMVTVPTTGMAKFGSGGGAATLQRSKLNLKREVRQVEPKTDDSGGGGGIGKIIHNGGGGGGDDDDDDDYFFEEGDDGEEGGDKFFSKIFPQLYDKFSVGAVLSEWYRTVADMPVMLRRAVEMGLFSSAQLHRFLSMDVRPNACRTVQRHLPTSMSRGFVGRLMADPAFCHKLLIENVLTMMCSVAYEMKMRGENFMKELDLVAIQTLGLMTATTTAVWLVAPNRSYGAANKYPWQEAIAGLPNNVFDASGPLRQYNVLSRFFSLAVKSAELAALGIVTGVTTCGLSRMAIMGHQAFEPGYRPSYDPPSPSRAALGLSLFYGLHVHARYQLLGGIDRFFFEYSNYLWSYLSATITCRISGALIGEAHRPIFTGLPTKPVRIVRRQKLPRSYRKSSVASNVVPAPPSKPKITKTKGFELTMSQS